MPFLVTVSTMFPEAFSGPLGVSLIGTAWRERGLSGLETADIRGFSNNRAGRRLAYVSAYARMAE